MPIVSATCCAGTIAGKLAPTGSLQYYVWHFFAPLGALGALARTRTHTKKPTGEPAGFVRVDPRVPGVSRS
jgi:hypothetical protein